MKRTCIQCGQSKTASTANFMPRPKPNSSTMYLSRRCRHCINAERRAKRQPNESGRIPGNIYAVPQNLAQRQYVNRVDSLLRNYNLEIDDYIEMVDKQRGCCAICNESLIGTQGTMSPYVDHCHRTGQVRGLLCNSCNTALGLFNDNVQILEKAIRYVVNEGI